MLLLGLNLPNKIDKYSHDVDWSIITRLKNMGISFIRDNALERGPLKTINMGQSQNDAMKFQNGVSNQSTLYDITLHKFPCTVEQYPTDTYRQFWKGYNHPIGYVNLQDNGWIVPGDWYDEIGDTRRDEGPKKHDYHLNKQGFRHDGTAIDIASETGGVIYMGDSHVMGVGLDLKDTWTYMAHHNCKATKDLRYLNMGQPGKGIETQYRLLKKYIDIVKPDIVVSAYPWAFTRAEVWDYTVNDWGSITINKLGRAKANGEERVPDVRWNFHTAASYLRYYKCIDAMKWLCYNAGAKFYALEEETDDKIHNQMSMNYTHRIDKEDLARDLVHAGKRTHESNGNILADIMERLFWK